MFIACLTVLFGLSDCNEGPNRTRGQLMKFFSEFSGQTACERGQRQHLCLTTLAFIYVSIFVSVWPDSEVVDRPLNFGLDTNAIAPGFWSQ